MILPVAPKDHRLDDATSRPQGLILRKKLPEQLDDTAEQRNTQGVVRHGQFDIDCIDGQFCEVSISHDSDWATAVAIVPILGEWQGRPDPKPKRGGKV